MNVEPWSDVHEGDDLPVIVRGLQYLLRGHGHVIVADGLFGPATRAAMTAFQGAHGIPASGVVDLPTWLALVRTTRLGSSGEFVRRSRASNCRGGSTTTRWGSTAISGR